jgi:hypothetical protein
VWCLDSQREDHQCRPAARISNEEDEDNSSNGDGNGDSGGNGDGDGNGNGEEQITHHIMYIVYPPHIK